MRIQKGRELVTTQSLHLCKGCSHAIRLKAPANTPSMAAVMSSTPTLTRPICRAPNALPSARSPPSASPGGRRHCLFLLTAATALKAIELPSAAAGRPDSIPLFGLRKKIEKAEEAAEEVVKEGIQAAEKGLQAAEKQIEKAEKQIEKAEIEVETAALTVDAALQAGAVVGAELLGVVVATSIVNGILGSES